MGIEELEDSTAREWQKKHEAAQKAYAREEIGILDESTAKLEKSIKSGKKVTSLNYAAGLFGTVLAGWFAYSVFKDLNAEHVDSALVAKDAIFTLTNGFLGALNFYIVSKGAKKRAIYEDKVSELQSRKRDLEEKLI